MTEMSDLEQKLRSLLRGPYSSLTVGFNDDHACNYTTAQGFHDEWGHYGGGADEDRVRWASEAERAKALAENSVWTIQWYPDTPVGFICVGASTLAAAVEAALDCDTGR